MLPFPEGNTFLNVVALEFLGSARAYCLRSQPLNKEAYVIGNSIGVKRKVHDMGRAKTLMSILRHSSSEIYISIQVEEWNSFPKFVTAFSTISLGAYCAKIFAPGPVYRPQNEDSTSHLISLSSDLAFPSPQPPKRRITS